MANKSLLRSIAGRLLPKANMRNEAGGIAYAFSAEHALAQYAATGCLNSTFYASDAEQLDQVLGLCQKVAPEFIARTALYARQKGFMKDLPALLSGSMHSPVTGVRQGATAAVRCIDVAALVAAAVLRKNPHAEVIPFESDVVRVSLNPRDSVMTNAQRLASLPCGGTNCSAPLRELNRRKATGSMVIYVSDNESWIDAPHYGRFGGGATETMRQWAEFQRRSPQAKMVCIDLQPYGHTQAKERPDIVNVGGFSDQVFSLIAEVAAGGTEQDHWVRAISAMTL